MNILIVGDSFAADWSAESRYRPGWPNLLSNDHNVTNLAQAGVSEYKIYKQLTSVSLDRFDLVIVAHTSPYRIVTKTHPVHSANCLHKHADLLFSDVEYHVKSFKGWLNKSLRSAYNFFIFHFDQEYQEVTYRLFVEKIDSILQNKPTITIITPIALVEYITQINAIHISSNQVVPGLANHMPDSENFKVYQEISRMLNEIKKS